ncbi:MAG: membrane protein insertase YidC [Alphaproteobacteria bacterium 33-17]|nr:MAG: membrane protein insertase YidC [Alphaproteobacteria bacterium 33-17]
MENIKSIIKTFVVAALVVLGVYYFLGKNNTAIEQQNNVELVKPEVAIEASKNHRIHVVTPKFKGSIDLKGIKFDDLTLLEYHEEASKESPKVKLLNPNNTEIGYFSNFGWLSNDSSVKLPNAETIWRADSHNLTPDNDVDLTWDNGEGLHFHVKIEVDDDYMFSVTQTVKNNSAKDVVVMPYGLVSKMVKNKVDSSAILHEGPVGLFNGILNEMAYEKLKDEVKVDHRNNSKGWLGISDKYWLTTVVPDSRYAFDASYNYKIVNGIDRFQVDFLGQKIALNKGASTNYITHFYAGTKSINILDEYERTLGIDKFDHAIDFGWLYFLTKPFFVALQFIYKYTYNFGIAILVFTVLIKLIMLPLANKSYASITKMKELNPVVARLKEKYKDDKMRFNYELMQLYKREKINPLSGCVPIIIQIPVFFALYKVLYITIEMRHAPFFGWIQDLSAPDPTSILNFFGLAPWAAPSFLSIGILPILMGISMYAQQRLNPEPADPVQAQISKFMPLVFTVMFYNFPSGLVLYWVWNNILSILQQLYVQKRVKKELNRF